MGAIDNFFASKSKSQTGTPSPIPSVTLPRPTKISPIDAFFAKKVVPKIETAQQETTPSLPSLPVQTLPKAPVLARGPRISDLPTGVRDPYKDTITAPTPGFFDKPGFISTATKTLKETFEDVVQRGVDLTNVLAPSGEYSEETKRFEVPKVTPSQRVKSMVSLGTGIVNLAFAPVSAALAGAEDLQLSKEGEAPGLFEIPKAILKYGAKGISYPLKKISEGAGFVTEKGFEQLPQTEAVQQFKEPTKEAVSLLALLLTGKAVQTAVKTPRAIAEKVGEVRNVNNVVKTASDILDVPLKKDVLGRYKKPDVKEVSSAYRRSAHEAHPDRGGSAQEFGVIKAAKDILDDYNSLTSKEFRQKWNAPLETVKQGVKGFLEQGPKEGEVAVPAEPTPIDQFFAEKKKVAETVPSTPAGTPPSLSAELAPLVEPKIEPGRALVPETAAIPSLSQQPPVAIEVKPLVEGVGQSVPTLAEVPKSEIVEPKAKTEAVSMVLSRLRQENPILGDELTYEQQNLQANAEKAVDLIAQDSKQAFRIAMGVETPPVGQTSTAVNIALAEKALNEGNHDLYSKLVRNRSIEQTRRGQEIVAEKGSVTDNSTSRYVKELVKNRLDKLGSSFLGRLNDKMLKKTVGKKAVDVIDREVAKVKERIKSNKDLDLEEAQSFLDSLACK